MHDNILIMFYYWAYPVVHVFHFSLTTLGTNLKSENTIVVLVAGPTKLNMPRGKGSVTGAEKNFFEKNKTKFVSSFVRS